MASWISIMWISIRHLGAVRAQSAQAGDASVTPLELGSTPLALGRPIGPAPHPIHPLGFTQ